ncbi:MAG: PPC domain-containing DNA-binding protein [Patescibacteria group bacterium]
MQQLTFRLHPGDLLKEEIENRTKHISAGVLLSIVGALENANLRMAGATAENQIVKNLVGPFEIVSGTGTISADGCHIHIAVSDQEGKVLGGHLKDSCRVGVTVEIVIGLFEDVKYKRVFDATTGFQELEVA